MVSSLLWDLGTTGVAEVAGDGHSSDLVAGFESRDRAERAVAEVQRRRGADRPDLIVAVDPVDDSTWTGATPTAAVQIGGRTIEIDVGPAFGHGGHPTTALALGLLAEAIAELSTPQHPVRVLDFGTGTGVLTLAALAAGASSVLAVDNDEAALAVAASNIARHHDLGPGTVELADRLPTTPSAGAGAGGQFEVIVANVLLPVQLAFAGGLVELLAEHGRLVLAGVLDDQADRLLEAHRALPERTRRQIDGWTGVIVGTPAPTPTEGTTT